MGAFKVAGRAFSSKVHDPEALIAEIVNLANIGRKEGLLALEKATISEPFLQDGIRMLVDGTSQEVVKAVMAKDMQQSCCRDAVDAGTAATTTAKILARVVHARLSAKVIWSLPRDVAHLKWLRTCLRRWRTTSHVVFVRE